MRNPILVLWISMEHYIIPFTIVNSLFYSRFFVRRFYPDNFEHYCVVCGRKYTNRWWD